MECYKKMNNKKIVLFSHDAGGAQVMSSYFHFFEKKLLYICCNHKTEGFFKEKNIKYKKMKFNDAIKYGDIFYTSTSWNSDLEKRAIKELLKKNKKIISFIDGWTNYKERFILNKKYYFPNEIWAFDKYAYKKCLKVFPKYIKIKLKKNYFYKFAKTKILNYKAKKNFKNKCTFFTEPLSKTYKKIYDNKPEYSELEAFEFFLNNIKKIEDIKLIDVKIHPNDTKYKYIKIIKKNSNLKIKIINHNIFKILAESYYLASCSSSVMYVGEKNNNSLICTIPKKKILSPLPIKNMKFLRDL
tara:strand:+ start:1048 stop:1944 length:897 start_codon:yes stop_codon:yes gene_type:complete